ncbi:ABC transporter permease subunit [Rhodobacterales bacterium HKCCE2091]|nr:ABC transporter permease subunit [Rhodobacterales bacterium HKCCE2091]
MTATAEELAEGTRLRARKRRQRLMVDAGLLVFCVLMLMPLVFLIGNAFKTPQELLAWPPTIIPQDPTLENFRIALAETSLLRWLGNSIAFALSSTAAIVATSAITGYVMAKFPFRSINVLFFLFLATAVVPFEVYMIPLYFQVRALGLLDSIGGLLIGYLVMSFGIFLIRQNTIHSIPDELIEAARVDGAGELWIFWHIALPLLRGAMGALAVLAFFQAWTAFAWPIVVTSREQHYTVEVGLALFQTGYTVDTGLVSAASTIVLIPSVLVFVLLRRNFVQGVASTGMKE